MRGERAADHDHPPIEHLEGCLAGLERVDELLRAAPVPRPTELEWARLAAGARRWPGAVSSWRVLAAAVLVAVLVPATLAWLLPPCRRSGGPHDAVAPSLDNLGI